MLNFYFDKIGKFNGPLNQKYFPTFANNPQYGLPASNKENISVTVYSCYYFVFWIFLVHEIEICRCDVASVLAAMFLCLARRSSRPKSPAFNPDCDYSHFFRSVPL